MIVAVIGKNFGDEGKGLAVDDFCSRVPRCLVVKHNGGAQAGHTVCHGNMRFVFHQLSSGSFRGADTYWASTYYPDLFKLREELHEYGEALAQAGTSAGGTNGADAGDRIYASKDTPLTYIDDVILNMALEESRGDERHGSCGMGINEAGLRTKAGFGITFGELVSMDAERLVKRMGEIRREYVIPRFTELGLGRSEYEEMLHNEAVLLNAAGEMIEAAKYVKLVEDEAEFLRSQENIVFESGQGLLLDSENEEFAPHVTASRTGLTNVVQLLDSAGLSLTEVCYVSRTYVTRHGAGNLPHECPREELGIVGVDQTNVENPWQGSIRYAKHVSVAEFLEPVAVDVGRCLKGHAIQGQNAPCVQAENKTDDTVLSIYLTHLNETSGQVVFADGSMPVEDLMRNTDVRKLVNRFYLSDDERKCAEIKDLEYI